MTSLEQQFISQLQEFIHNGDLERTPVLEEFAEQFSELCHGVCERLRRCSEYLEKGMRSEAVHEAQSPPDLLELAALVQFPELKKWRNICLDMELSMFPDIPQEVIERLREACARERALEPLLKQYRLAVYQGDRKECIRILRKLRETDGSNPSWEQNLTPLEEAALPELVEAVYAALDAGDLGRLKTLYAEVTHPQRAVPVPATVLNEVDTALSAERRAGLRDAAGVLGRKLHDVLREGDIAAVERMLGEWDRLSADGTFEADGEMLDLVRNARERVDTHRREQAERDEFGNACAELRTILADSHASPADWLPKWETLQGRGQPLPNDLSDDVKAALDAHRHRQQLRRRAVTAVCTAAVLVLAAVLVTGFFLRQRQQRRQAILATMEQLVSQQDFLQLRQHLDAVRDQDSGLYRSPRVQHFEVMARDALKTLEAKEVRFRSLMESLKQIRREGFNVPEDRIRNLVSEARDSVYNDDSARDLNAWEDSWQTWRSLEMRRINGGVEQATALARKSLAERQRQPFQSIEAEKQALSMVETALSDAERTAKQASEEVAKSYNDTVLDIAAWRRDLEERERRFQQRDRELAELRRDVRGALPNLRDYGALLSRFVEKFPDEPETASYRRALVRLDDCIRADALAAFSLSGVPASAEEAEQLRVLVGDEGPLRGSVWEDDLRSCLDCTDRNEDARTRIPMLIMDKKEMLDVMVLYYRKRGEENWHPLYYPTALTSRTETDENGHEQRVYWGRVYHCERADQTPWLAHTSEAFPGKLSSRDYEIRIQHRQQDNVVPQGRFLYRVVAESMEARELDVHLLRSMHALVESTDIDPVPLAWVLKGLVGVFDAVFRETIPECAELSKLVNGLRTDVPWMNPEHPDVLAAGKEIRAALTAFPDTQGIIDRLQAQHRLLAFSVSRKVRCIGSYQPNAEGEPAAVLAAPVPRNVWVLSREADTNRTIFMVVGRGNAGDIITRDDLLGSVYSGLVLFGPGDGRTCEDALRELPATVRKEDLRRPDSWPLNRW